MDFEETASNADASQQPTFLNINDAKNTEQQQQPPEYRDEVINTLSISRDGASNDDHDDEEFKEFLIKLDLIKFYPKQLSLNDILQIDSRSLDERKPTSLENVPWYFLHNVMRANINARYTNVRFEKKKERENTGAVNVSEDEDDCVYDDILQGSENPSTDMFSPLDVITAIFLCSNSFLQQQLMAKMFLCQFALPLIIPNTGDSDITYLLWAMRQIVLKWIPPSSVNSNTFAEGTLVKTPMPMMSFIRVGNGSFSKSKTLNSILRREQHNTFIHRDMECGDFARKISNGLVETSLHLPSGEKHLNLFPDVFAISNLRGDARECATQLEFLKEASDSLFVFVHSIEKSELEFLTKLSTSKAKIILIINPSDYHNVKKNDILKALFKKMKLKTEQIISRGNENEAKFLEKLRSSISLLTSTQCQGKYCNLEEKSDIAKRLNMKIDEDEPECQEGKKLAKKVFSKIPVEDIEMAKTKLLPCQGELWQQWSVIDKEQCRLKNINGKSAEHYIEELEDEKKRLRRAQSDNYISELMKAFLKSFLEISVVKRKYFLQWLKLELDEIFRVRLSNKRNERYVQHEGNANATEESQNPDRMAAMDPLGLEHFLREAGQLYEAWKATGGDESYRKLPCVAADLFLDGLAIELMDGDTGHIPIEWVTDVLNEVSKKLCVTMGRDAQIYVVTVLGVQSTGKSTLLNTMLGLQFAVSSGRCTRGAFMQLIAIQENLRRELQCDYVLVIDTEGLKAPELANQKNSHERDNELATLTVGLSDTTIINLSMEISEEMKDVLEIVVHAFLRMTAIGKKPNCQFIHQHSGDVSAHDKNSAGHEILLKQLDEMTKLVAKKEQKEDSYTGFSDVIDHDRQKDNWYMPALWDGSPMSPVYVAYSEKTFQLKKHMFDYIQKKNTKQMPLTITEFQEWIRSIWISVKNENFIFSFKNILVADAYNKLSTEFGKWEWEFRKTIIFWKEAAENKILNSAPNSLNTLYADLQKEADEEVLKCKDRVLKQLEEYFGDKNTNAHLIEQYKTDFLESVNILNTTLKNEAHSTCQECISRQTSLHSFDAILPQNIKKIGQALGVLLGKCKDCKEEAELETEFETMWEDTVSRLPKVDIKRPDIALDMENKLRKHMKEDANQLNKRLKGKSLSAFRENRFKVLDKHLRISNKLNAQDEHEKQKKEVDDKASSLITIANKFLVQINHYTPDNCDELLFLLNRQLETNHNEIKLFNKHFEVDITLHICSNAIEVLQTKNDSFLQKNDPFNQVTEMKALYLNIFKVLHKEGGDGRTSWLDRIHEDYKKVIAIQIISLLRKCANEKLNKGELAQRFEDMWSTTLAQLPRTTVTRRNIEEDMEAKLKTIYGDLIGKWTDKKYISSLKQGFVIIEKHYDRLTFIRNVFGITKVNLEILSTSLIGECDRLIQMKCDESADYDHRHFDDIIQILKDRLDNAVKINYKFSDQFRRDITFHICHKAVKMFKKKHDRFCELNSQIKQLEDLKSTYLQTMIDLLQEGDSIHNRAQSFCNNCLKPAVLKSVQKKLGTKIVDNLKDSRHFPEFSTRKHLSMAILCDLMGKENFEMYHHYIHSNSTFTKTWIKHRICSHFEKSDQISKLHRIAGEIAREVLIKVETAVKTIREEGNLTTCSGFLESLAQYLKSDIVTPKDLMDVFGSHIFNDNDDGAAFAFELQRSIELLKTTNLVGAEKDFDVGERLASLPVQPYEHVYELLKYCKEQCPFCRVPCEQTAYGHKKHGAEIHCPVGISYWTDTHTRELSNYICTTNVASTGCFKSRDTNYEWVAYGKYQTVNDKFSSWEIKPDTRREASLYWKWVFCKFNEEFAKTYQSRPSNLPWNWHKITKEDAYSELKKVYGNQ